MELEVKSGSMSPLSEPPLDLLSDQTMEMSAEVEMECAQRSREQTPLNDTALLNDIAPLSKDGGQDPPGHASREQTPLNGIVPLADDSDHDLLEHATPEQTPPKDITPQKYVTPLPKPPSLLDQALAAVAGKAKDPLSRGDVAVALDVKDLTKTILLDSNRLDRPVREFIDQNSKDNGALQGGVRLLFTLKAAGGGHGMPTSERRALDTPALEVDVAVVSENAASAEAKTVKQEAGDIGNELGKSPKTNWVRAYESFFRMMLNMPSISVKQVRMPTIAASALTLLEGVVAIAEYYGCVPTVSSAFKSLSSDWISNRTLYAAIAADAARWLALAVKLQSELVFKEAFVHLVGQHPHFTGSSSGCGDRLPADVMASIVAQGREMRITRYEVDQQLLMTTLRVETPAKGRLSPAVSGTVSQHHESQIYDIVNVWRDWLTEHMSYLCDAAVGGVEEVPASSALCDHLPPPNYPGGQPECLTVAGFYRLLHRAGDAYLPVEQVVETWNEAEYGSDFGAVRVNLAVLKARAREMVRPLVQSSLQLAGGERGGLPYLTCVEVGKVPWASEEEEEEEDVEMED